LIQKSGVIDFGTWFFDESEQRTPWSGVESAALVAAAETALERQLSRTLMQGTKPQVRHLKAAAVLCEQDGKSVATIGPGAILGERAYLEGGARTATLRATTACTVAVAAPESIGKDSLSGLAAGHRRES
jgi:hypothetical protein